MRKPSLVRRYTMSSARWAHSSRRRKFDFGLIQARTKVLTKIVDVFALSQHQPELGAVQTGKAFQ